MKRAVSMAGACALALALAGCAACAPQPITPNPTPATGAMGGATVCAPTAGACLDPAIYIDPSLPPPAVPAPAQGENRLGIYTVNPYGAGPKIYNPPIQVIPPPRPRARGTGRPPAPPPVYAPATANGGRMGIYTTNPYGFAPRIYNLPIRIVPPPPGGTPPGQTPYVPAADNGGRLGIYTTNPYGFGPKIYNPPIHVVPTRPAQGQ